MDRNTLLLESPFFQVFRYIFWTSRNCHELGSEDLLNTVGFGLRTILYNVAQLKAVIALEVSYARFQGRESFNT